MDLNKKLEELKPYQLNCNVFDVYSYNGLSMQDLLCQFFTKINECVTLSNETIDLAKWLVNEGLTEEVAKNLLLWLNDGTLENLINVNLFNSLNNKINQIVINVKDFGVIGDGVTDDTINIKKCFEYAKLNNFKVKFPEGEYLINSNDEWLCPKIISEGATLQINGGLRFILDGDIELKGLTIITNDNGGYGVYDNTSNGYLFKPKNITQKISYSIIENVKIIGNVLNDKRIIGGIRINECKEFVKISNVYGENIGGLISLLGDSNNISVRDIVGYNIETLVQSNGGFNAIYDNLKLINTQSQYQWWIGKEVGVHYNGKDTLLIEGGKFVTMSNIYGEYCIERPVYCQASDVNAYNLTSINTGCFKFVGAYNGSRKVDNIKITNATIKSNVDDNRDSWGQIYGCNDIEFNNLTIKSDNVSKNYFFIGGYNGVITFNNLIVEGLDKSLFAKSGGVTEKVIINNCFFSNNKSVTTDGLVFIKNTNTSNSDVIINLEINGLESNNNENYVVRSLIKCENTNPVANNIILKNINVNGLGVGQYSCFGVEYLLNTVIDNMVNNNTYSISGYTGSSMYENRNLISNNKVKMITSSKDGDVEIKININKDNSETDNILNFINEVVLLRKNTSDYSFELPVKNNYNWKIKIESKNGGLAEYFIYNGLISEIYKTSDMFNITSYPSTPTANKLNIYINNDTGFLTVRDRIVNDSFIITVSKHSSII